MAKTPRKPQLSPSQAKAPTELLVKQAANHVRLEANEVIPYSRTDGIKLFVLSRGRRPAGLGQFKSGESKGSPGAQPIRFEVYATELAEISLPHAVAFNLAMRLIEHTLGKDEVTPSLINDAMSGIIKRYEKRLEDKNTEVDGGDDE